VEINSGGFLPPIHLPVEQLRESQDARQEYLGEFSSRGLTLTALNCNGNPLHPAAGFPHSRDLVDSIELAALLGVKRVITMSGTPGGEPNTTVPVWNPLPWWSPFLDVQDHQWSVAIPYWKDIQARAAEADVKIAIEMHPGNIVFNPRTMHRLAEEINATHVGAEMDPSHLFWQGIDPVLAIADLGELVYNAAAKDTRINEAAGPGPPRGTSSRSGEGTTRRTGPSSSGPCTRSTRTCRSTSSTRTRSSTSSRACASRPRP
jgi:sugar phosphate isomerase/epimerase